MAWVRNPITGNLLPFWLGPQLEDVVRDLRPNEPLPPSVPPNVRFLLAAANILLPEDRCLGQGHQRQRRDGSARRLCSFAQKGYAPLAGLIHPFHVAALRRYYRYLIRTGAIGLGDGQSSAPLCGLQRSGGALLPS